MKFASGFVKTLLLIIGVCVVSCLVTIAVLKKDVLLNEFSKIVGNVQSNIVPLSEKKNLFSGNLRLLPDDLHLFVFNDVDVSNGVDTTATYYEAGVYESGEYKGYTRIIAIRPAEGPGDPYVFVLATKDKSSYVLSDEDELTKYPEDDWRNPMKYLDKTKIRKITVLPGQHPKGIPLDSLYVLYRESIPVTSVKTGKKDSFGQDTYADRIVETFTNYPELTSPLSTLTFLGNIYEPPYLTDQMLEEDRQKVRVRQQYVLGTTSVVTIDEVGLPWLYTLSRKRDITVYEEKLALYNSQYTEYQKQQKLWEDEIVTTPPEYPSYPEKPNVRFEKSTIVGGDGQFFGTYDVALPQVCGVDVNTLVMKNISDADLEKVGSVYGQPVYALKNADHPLLTLAFENKMTMPEEEFEAMNEGLPKLTREGYVDKRPLLFFKDFWGRLLSVGEYEYKMMGGCGKPVLYLYPEKPLDVRVTFEAPVDLTRDMPSYANGWMVEAKPDGSLSDLQPDKTDCSGIDSSLHGLEYAWEACTANAYPYIYWSGNRRGAVYPTGKDGFVVSSDELSTFLPRTLSSLGLSETEEMDMVSYWLPEIAKKDAPWYFIRFLETRELNAFIPLHIEPQPDTLFRIFLDWKPLETRPLISPEPQNLTPLTRNGFTVVEWGGLKQ